MPHNTPIDDLLALLLPSAHNIIGLLLFSILFSILSRLLFGLFFQARSMQAGEYSADEKASLDLRGLFPSYRFFLPSLLVDARLFFPLIYLSSFSIVEIFFAFFLFLLDCLLGSKFCSQLSNRKRRRSSDENSTYCWNMVDTAGWSAFCSK